tara:strand:+ start:2473 stop:3189 length:717 start_codon:yes stop_codon:yes gene_type:complete
MSLPNFMHQQTAKSHDNYIKNTIIDKNFARRESFQIEQACLAHWLPLDSNEKILELGCGPGKFIPILDAMGFKVVGVDPVEFSSWNSLISKNITLKSKIFAECLPFDDHTFDHAVCLGALLYFNNPEKALKELNRVIKPGGKVIIRTVNRMNFYTSFTGKKLDPASKNLYTLPECIELLETSGFSVKKHFSHGFWPPYFTNLWWYLISVWLPIPLQRFLSLLTPSSRRINNILFATRI